MDISSQINDGFYSDLACERRRVSTECKGVEFKRTIERGFTWERIRITSAEGEREIGRPVGLYDTLSLKRADLITQEELFGYADEAAIELRSILKRKGAFPKRLLAVGLGNDALTPDSLGSKCIERIRPTMHLPKEMLSGICEIAVFCPGVSSKSGIDSVVAVSAICKAVRPDAVIAIDALTAGSPERLGATLQFSDTGICPGSGVGGKRRELSERTLGVPVIAIGMPTVVSAGVLCGSAKESVCNMTVAPREIDVIVDTAAEIIALGINDAFLKKGTL